MVRAHSSKRLSLLHRARHSLLLWVEVVRATRHRPLEAGVLEVAADLAQVVEVARPSSEDQATTSSWARAVDPRVTGLQG